MIDKDYSKQRTTNKNEPIDFQYLTKLHSAKHYLKYTGSFLYSIIYILLFILDFN